jgi:membrane-bound lytic murein transglycosylase A
VTALLLAGCQTAPPQKTPPPPVEHTSALSLSPVDFEAIPGWAGDDQAAALPALAKSCAALVDLPPGEAVGRTGLGGTVADWLGPCAALARVPANDPAAARDYFAQWFAAFKMTDGDRPTGLLTAYYESELTGALTPGGRFTVPLYARPSDLLSVDLGLFDPRLRGETIWGRLSPGGPGGGKLVPYPTRAEIENGALGAKAVPLIWVENPVDAHILSIQGSGRILLDNGASVRVGYDGTNGRPFVGLGQILVRANKVQPGAVTMPAIRDWLIAHPDQATALMDENPRYIFFRKIIGDGPVGAAGLVLTPGRSLAIDPAFVPMGAPVFIATQGPDGRPLQRLMVAQDAGAAIKGALRGDIFWGTGPAAFEQAGRMSRQGAFYILLPRHRSGQLADAR